MPRIEPYLILLILLPTLASAEGLAWQSPGMASCSLLSNSGERLACYDRLSEGVKIPIYPVTDERPAPPDSDDDEETGDDAHEEDTQPVGPQTTLAGQSSLRDSAMFSYSGTYVPHRRNYILPMSYQHDVEEMPSSPVYGNSDLGDLDNVEVKFQLSFKLPLLTGIFDDQTRLWFGYTQISLWQAYNEDQSRPFRETNFKPEVFLTRDFGISLGPGFIDYASIGFLHHSNGQPDPRSRSWDRIIGEVVYSTSRWAFSVRPWYRIREGADREDNPDIQRFLGYADFNMVYQSTGDHTFGLRANNNFRRNDNKTSVELNYAFPLTQTLKGYVQYFNGYGETLIDYNNRVNRIGVGILVTDWF